jgi:hypothetical protein
VQFKSRHALWRYLQTVHPWYFLILAIMLGALCLQQLRSNNEKMAELRTAVFVADKENGNVEQALFDLRSYVYRHMNTSLTSGANAVYPPIQLKYTYEREQAKQQAQLGQNNSNIYHEAQLACEAQSAGQNGSEAIRCIEQYAATKGVRLAPIPDGLYKFDFTSAKWSPDVAGLSMVGAIASALAFAVGTLWRVVRRYY